MAITPHFFNKRESEATTDRHVVPLPQVASKTPTVSTQVSPEAGRSNSTHISQRGAVTPPAGDTGAAPGSIGSKLTVGPNIKLKGVEITDCDTLFVEGLVEATMDSRLMEIAEQGAFKGSAEIDLAEIHGQFDGDLTVRQKLVIYATGRVTGKIRYGMLVVEEGGQLSGDIQFGTASAAKHSSADKPLLAVANKGSNMPLAQ